MEIRPYAVKLADCLILGLTSTWDTGEARLGLALVFFEIGLRFESQKLYYYACSGCGAIGHAIIDELPLDWKKRYRPDKTHFFLCPNCDEEGK